MNVAGFTLQPISSSEGVSGLILATPALPAGLYEFQHPKFESTASGGHVAIRVRDTWPSSGNSTPEPGVCHRAVFLADTGETQELPGGAHVAGPMICLVHALHGHPNPIGWVEGEKLVLEIDGTRRRLIFAYHGDHLVAALAPHRRT